MHKYNDVQALVLKSALFIMASAFVLVTLFTR